jgi:hypothetical protein
MPTVSSSQVQDDLETVAPAMGLPVAAIAPMLGALSAAGYELVEASSGDRAELTTTTTGERHRVEGIPGAFLCGCAAGDRGHFGWLEFVTKDGGVSRLSLGFVSGGDSLLESPE